MKIAIACGGTGGHIFPGLATARILHKRGHNITLWLSGKDMESTALENWDGAVVTVPSIGFPARASFHTLVAFLHMLRATQVCIKLMKRDIPDIVLGMGSYASAPPVLAARYLHIPIVLHESNAIAGRAVKFLSRFSDALAIGFDEACASLSHKHIVFTGTPLRHNFKEADSYLWRPLHPDVFTILIMGGSRGAHALNLIASDTIISLYESGHKLQVIHLTGLADEKTIRERYTHIGVPNVVFSFLNTMAQAYQYATIAICRAGAVTCAEICYYAIPALLVPYPWAMGQHQLANARALKKAGVADAIEQKYLSVGYMSNYILKQMENPDRLEGMRQAAKKRTSVDAASALANLVLHTATTALAHKRCSEVTTDNS